MLAPGTDVNTVGTVEPGSPAARAGIVPGDVVVPVEAEHALAVMQLFHRVVAGRPIAYAVIHDGQRRVVPLTAYPGPRLPAQRRCSSWRSSCAAS